MFSSILPAPKNKYEVFAEEQEIDEQVQQKPIKRAPQYPNRVGFVPQELADFDDGGAYPEILLVQYPLNMGNPAVKSTAVVSVDVNEKGEVRFDAIAKLGRNKGKLVQTSLDDIKEKKGDSDLLAMPDDDEAQKAAEKTRLALEAMMGSKLQVAVQPNKDTEPTFIRYTPNPNAPGANPDTKERVIRMVEAQVDPLEPPKHKSVKVPRGPPSPPAPVLHSPTRKLTVADQQAWKVPPCVSNWKNGKGFIIPLDKRLAADGRGLQEVTINNQFATLSEALYVAERKAAEDLRYRNEVRKKVAMQEKEDKEKELRDVAARARSERSSLLSSSSSSSSSSDSYYGPTPSSLSNPAPHSLPPPPSPAHLAPSSSSSSSSSSSYYSSSSSSSSSSSISIKQEPQREKENGREGERGEGRGGDSEDEREAGYDRRERERGSEMGRGRGYREKKSADSDSEEERGKGHSRSRSRRSPSPSPSRSRSPSPPRKHSSSSSSSSTRERERETEREREREREWERSDSDEDRRETRRRGGGGREKEKERDRRGSPKEEDRRREERGGSRDTRQRGRERGDDRGRGRGRSRGRSPSDSDEERRQERDLERARREREKDLQREKEKGKTEEEEEKQREIEEIREREKIRMMKKKEAERLMRMQNMKGAYRKKKAERDEGRDISEKIALGMLKSTGQFKGEELFDQRLFNQSAGMDSGFGADDEYSAFSKPLFDRGEGSTGGSIYRPKRDDSQAFGDVDEQMKKLSDTSRFKPDKGFRGAEGGGRGGGGGGGGGGSVGGRSEPVQFERPGSSSSSSSSSSKHRYEDDSDDDHDVRERERERERIRQDREDDEFGIKEIVSKKSRY